MIDQVLRLRRVRAAKRRGDKVKREVGGMEDLVARYASGASDDATAVMKRGWSRRVQSV